MDGSRLSPIGAKLGTGLALFPLLPTAGWEKVPEGRMRAGARKRDGLASGTTAPLRVAALIRRFAPPCMGRFLSSGVSLVICVSQICNSPPCAGESFAGAIRLVRSPDRRVAIGPLRCLFCGTNRVSRARRAALRFTLDTRLVAQTSAAKRSNGCDCLTASNSTIAKLDHSAPAGSDRRRSCLVCGRTRHSLVCGEVLGISTMMQSCASGGQAPRWWAHSSPRHVSQGG